jgi:hypothetical protein
MFPLLSINILFGNQVFLIQSKQTEFIQIIIDNYKLTEIRIRLEPELLSKFIIIFTDSKIAVIFYSREKNFYSSNYKFKMFRSFKATT